MKQANRFKRCALAITLIVALLAINLTPAFAAEQINLNTATSEQIQEVNGIGQVKATAIMEAKPFKSWDEVLAVKGIGPKTLEKIQAMFKLE